MSTDTRKVIVMLMNLLKKTIGRYITLLLPSFVERQHTESYLARSSDLVELERRMIELGRHGH